VLGERQFLRFGRKRIQTGDIALNISATVLLENLC
jgi:hypothetical protein